MNSAKENIQYHIIKIVLKILSEISHRKIARLAVLLGKRWYHIDHTHRKIAFDNMTGAFGKTMNRSEIQNMVKANFIQLVRVILEIPSALKLNKNNLDTYVDFTGHEHLEHALSQEKGILIFSAHLGNWELCLLALSMKFNIVCNLLVRPLDYSPLDRMLTEIRSRMGNVVLDKIRSASTIGKVLSEKKILAIMLDQNASWYDGVNVPFFGRIACTNKGCALFALRYNPVVLPIFNIRRPDGRYQIIINPPVSLVRSNNVRQDVEENTILFNNIIEKHIRMAPDNWLWVHRRWRLKEIPERVKHKIQGLPLKT